MINSLRWRKSTKCASAACVEVAQTSKTYVRDSKNPAGQHLAFTHTDWSTFLTALTNGTL